MSVAIAGALEVLRDVELELRVEIGCARLSVAAVGELASGTVVELDHPIDRPVDLAVNGRVVARGEIVAVDGRFGLRIVELLEPAER